MINFTNQTIQIAQKILEHISYEPLVIPTFSSRVNVLNCDPFQLLHGLSNLQPGQVDLNFCDLPRASASGPVMLYCLNEAGEVINRHFDLLDNDYFTTLSANLIVIARLVKRTLAPNGVVGPQRIGNITLLQEQRLTSLLAQKTASEKWFTRRDKAEARRKTHVDRSRMVIFYGLSIANVSRFRYPKLRKSSQGINKRMNAVGTLGTPLKENKVKCITRQNVQMGLI